MKKSLRNIICAVLMGAGVITFSGCKFMALLAIAALAGVDGTTTTKTDSDHIDRNDDGSSQSFASTSSFVKLSKFHGNLSKVSSTKKLFSIQVNNAQTEKFETGYIVPYDYNRSAGEEKPSWTPVFDSDVRINQTPSFVTAFNENPENFITSSMARSSYLPGVEDGGSDSGNVDSIIYDEGSEREFYVSKDNSSNSEFIKKTGVLKYKGNNCLIYLDKTPMSGIVKENNSYDYSGSYSFEDGDLIEIKDSFDKIYSIVKKVMGSDDLSQPITLYNGNKTYKSIQTSLNGDDSKLVIFITDIFGDKIGTEKGSVLGYYYPGDLYKKVNLKYSNECKMIYVDSYNLQLDVLNHSKICQSTVVHEFTHMLNKINKSDPMETWFTEMLAMTAEDICSHELNLTTTDKSSVFFQRLPFFNMTYMSGFSNEVWAKNDPGSAYSNTYAFGSYLLRNYGGVKLISEIATNDYVNEQAVTKALASCGKSSENFNSVLSKFGQVLCNFDLKTTKDSYITLNRSFRDTFKETNFQIKAIDLKQYNMTVKDDKTGQTQKYVGPVYGDAKYRYSLGGWGIEVKDFGSVTNYQTFDCQLPTNESCDLYVYLK